MPEKTKTQTELDFLAAVEAGETVSQSTLAKRVAVSVGLVNALVRRAVAKGFVKMRQAPRKRYAYYLTPKGFAEKSRLVAEYLDNSLDFFRRARHEYGECFARARACGFSRIALVGSGELAEIALLAAHEAEIEVVFVLDRATNKERLLGIAVARTPEDLATGADAVLITEHRAPQQAFEAVRPLFADAAVFAPPFLRIVRTGPGDAAP